MMSIGKLLGSLDTLYTWWLGKVSAVTYPASDVNDNGTWTDVWCRLAVGTTL